MARKKYGPLGYIFSASLMSLCLLFVGDEFLKNSSGQKGLVIFYLIFLMLSVLWDIIGMISLVSEGVRRRLIIGIAGIIFQIGIYSMLWQKLGLKIGEISF